MAGTYATVTFFADCTSARKFRTTASVCPRSISSLSTSRSARANFRRPMRAFARLYKALSSSTSTPSLPSMHAPRSTAVQLSMHPSRSPVCSCAAAKFRSRSAVMVASFCDTASDISTEALWHKCKLSMPSLYRPMAAVAFPPRNLSLPACLSSLASFSLCAIDFFRLPMCWSISSSSSNSSLSFLYPSAAKTALSARAVHLTPLPSAVLPSLSSSSRAALASKFSHLL
mmetsp:Transcript_62170/g.115372  ORF Transcript_62170/g.115372 Transcript_62170/m.115372 type:complete len:229 (+) Transcript_62170:57-743(+)